ncbi:DNA-directed RNA polymerase [Candidatus Pacearchaeota archaeon]|nr:DNA-directed RNA polymerase [Candidatus Pacearchaeota archaeon]
MAFRHDRGFRRFPPEMTKIKCSECGKEAEVPFKPREGSPVYCRECFMKKKGIKPREEQEESQDME